MHGKSRIFELKLSKSIHANALEVYSWSCHGCMVFCVQREMYIETFFCWPLLEYPFL